MPEPPEASPSTRQEAEGTHIVQAVNSTVTIIDGDPVPVLVPPVRLNPGPRTSAARLLRAGSSVVEFVDRAGVLRGLHGWALDGDRVAVQVVAGVGGTGKTRLAVELCHELSRDSWHVGFLSAEASEASMVGLAGESVPRLVVVDYAETRVEQVGVLLRSLQLSGSSAPARVVLLVRQPSTNAALAAEDPLEQWVSVVRPYGDEVADQLLDEARVVVLNEKPFISEDRRQLFDRALAAYQPKEAPKNDARIDLDVGLYEQPLMIVMAGFLAARNPDEALPHTSDGLFEAILEHEAKYWRLTAEDAKLDLTSDELATLVAVATLTNVADEAEADEVLGLVPSHKGASLRDTRRASKWLSGLYRSDVDGARWSPLEPDRLGEYLVASRLSSLPEILGWVLRPTREGDLLVRPLTVLTRAASYQPLRDQVKRVLVAHVGGLVDAAVSEANNPDRYLEGRSRLPRVLGETITMFGPLLGDEVLRGVSSSLPLQRSSPWTWCI